MKRAVFCLVLFACTPRAPEDALDAYRRAVAAKDPQAILALSDASFRATFDEAAVAAALSQSTGLAPTRSKDQRAIFVLENGETIELVFEDGDWRVARGGVVPARFDTPEGALETFFRAAVAENFAVLRQTIPKRHRDQLVGDAALEKHIAAMADRIARARSRIGRIGPGRAVIHGERADLAYGPGLSVTFEREESGWVIVDLE
jgi:hypothetical protein